MGRALMRNRWREQTGREVLIVVPRKVATVAEVEENNRVTI
jgi:hypothetical protein